LEIKEINWQLTLPIRQRVLWPNEAELFCKLSGDENALHYGVFIKEKLVSVASIFIKDKQARLRKFATLTDYQGQGIGSKLISYILSQLSKTNANVFWCDARKTATGFYQKLGMAQQGSEFNKLGVHYIKMFMYLSKC